MKNINFFIIVLVLVSSCKTPSEKNQRIVQIDSVQNSGTIIAKDSLQNSATHVSRNSIKYESTVYDKITNEVCDCSLKNMKDNKLSTSLDSCYKLIEAKYSDSLKKMNINMNNQQEKLQLSNDIIKRLFLYCPNFSKLMKESK